MVDFMVSIIMPVYNAARYLDESIGSVLAQGYSNWELLCVDDGSSDTSLEILQHYAKKDKRIKTFSQQNSGPAQARKLAIENSIGDYVTYLDADDKLSDDFLDKTLASAANSGADVTMPILMQDCFSSKFDSWNFNERHHLVEGDVLDPRIAFVRTFPWSVHGLNLYKACHIKKFALTEVSNINNYNADEYLTRYLLLYANKVVISGGFYYYRANEASITRAFSLRKLGALIVNDSLFKLAFKEGFENSVLNGMAEHFYQQNISLKLHVIRSKDSLSEFEFKEALQKLNHEFSWQKNVPNFGIKTLKYKIFDMLPVRFSSFILKFRNES